MHEIDALHGASRNADARILRCAIVPDGWDTKRVLRLRLTWEHEPQTCLAWLTLCWETFTADALVPAVKTEKCWQWKDAHDPTNAGSLFSCVENILHKDGEPLMALWAAKQVDDFCWTAMVAVAEALMHYEGRSDIFLGNVFVKRKCDEQSFTVEV